MERRPGVVVPRTLEEACAPGRMALLVYDMQVGIASQLPNGGEIVAKVRRVLEAAREGGFPVFFSRHVSLARELWAPPSSGSGWPGRGSSGSRTSGHLSRPTRRTPR